MKHVIPSILYMLATFFSVHAQQQKAMTTEQLDSLCLLMSDEIRLKTPLEIADGAESITEKMRDSFVSYLHNTYYANGKKTLTASQKQTMHGTLLRISEGKLTIKEAEDYTMKRKYLHPTEMIETEYYFLDSKLVKISITVGRTDYNVLPSNYWIAVSQIDFVYYKTEPPKRAVYGAYYPMPPKHREPYPTNVLSTDEWKEMIMNHANITEEQLKTKAYHLYSLYIFNKKLFTH